MTWDPTYGEFIPLPANCIGCGGEVPAGFAVCDDCWGPSTRVEAREWKKARDIKERSA